MNLQKILIAFASGVIALVVGWFGGGAARDVWGDQYEVAVGVVEVDAGVPVATASPPPTDPPTEEPTDEATPVDTPGSILCDGAPPEENCDCDLQNGEWTWVCEAPATEEPTATPFPTFGPTPTPLATP